MTIAVCYKCCEFKFGAFLTCDKCGSVPRSEDELIYSLSMTEHYYDEEMLHQIAEMIRETKELPELSEEMKADYRPALKEYKQMIGSAKPPPKDFIQNQNPIEDITPWWKFWK